MGYFCFVFVAITYGTLSFLAILKEKNSKSFLDYYCSFCRREVLRDHLGLRGRNSQQRTEPQASAPQEVSVSDVSPDFLAALPSDIQEEVSADNFSKFTPPPTSCSNVFLAIASFGKIERKGVMIVHYCYFCMLFYMLHCVVTQISAKFVLGFLQSI